MLLKCNTLEKVDIIKIFFWNVHFRKCPFSLVTLSSFIFLQGALVLDFVCRIKLEAAFVVTGVKVGVTNHDVRHLQNKPIC